jgi:hypothetical protein
LTGRERLVAAARGGEVDRRPVLAWPFGDPEADAVVFHTDSGPKAIAEAGDRAGLVEVLNPFGLALQREILLNDLLRDTPELGDRVLEGLVGEVRDHIQVALHGGADGVLYRLHGARGLHCTPMQYGGHYLERDRELLSEITDARLNVVFVVGGDDAYLDFVSDLPAHLFAWDSKSSLIRPEQVRSMREGALCCADPEADVTLDPGTDHLSRMLESSLHTEDTDAV